MKIESECQNPTIRNISITNGKREYASTKKPVKLIGHITLRLGDENKVVFISKVWTKN